MPEQSSSSAQQQYIVTARKWRPQRFSDVVGQEHVSRTLRNAVESKRIHHAYIFNGPRGVGKTTTARILAKAVNCENPSADFEPCNTCPSCQDINTGRSMDVIEIDGASNNSVDDIRKLRENAKYPPVRGSYKMYIIDEVHMLSTSAFNALLKTLEEPPRHLLFVFATTEPHKVPATILSRCQRFDFRRMQIDEIATQLRYIATQENITIDDESLAIIGKKGDGSMRDSQSIFDQVLAFCGKNVEYARVNEALNLIDTEFYFTLGRAIREHDVAKILDIAREVFMRGYDLQECLHGLAEHFRNVLTVLATNNASLIEASKLHREQYTSESAHFTEADVLQYMTIIMNTEQQLRFAPQPRLRFEFALIQMAKMDSAVHISHLLAELAELKKKLPYLKDSHLSLDISHSSEKDNHSSSADSTTAAMPNQPMTNAQSTNAQSINNQPKPAPRIIPALELAESWKKAVESSERLDNALKTYLLAEDMVQVHCNDGEMVITSDKDFIADKFLDKKQHLVDVLGEALHCQCTVTVMGGTSNQAVSTFSFFANDAEEVHNALAKAAAEESDSSQSETELNSSVTSNGRVSTPNTVVEPSSASSPVAEIAGASPSSAKPSSTKKIPQETHELDRAIMEVFGASAVPLR